MSALYVDPAIGSHNPFYVDFDYPCQESKIIGFKRNTSCLLFLLFYLPASITDKRIPVGQDISCRRSFICHFETLIFVLKKCDISLWLESKTCYFPMWTFSSNVFLPIFRPSGENTELKRSPFRTKSVLRVYCLKWHGWYSSRTSYQGWPRSLEGGRRRERNSCVCVCIYLYRCIFVYLYCRNEKLFCCTFRSLCWEKWHKTVSIAVDSWHRCNFRRP